VYKSAMIDLSQSQPNGHASHNTLDIISYTHVYVLFCSRVSLVHFFAPAVVFPFLVNLSALVPSSLPIGPRVTQRLGSHVVHLCERIQVVASHWSSFWIQNSATHSLYHAHTWIFSLHAIYSVVRIVRLVNFSWYTSPWKSL
jgi:hypothetical protein